MKIKKGDTVVVIAGKDRTKSGKVIRVFPKYNKLYIEGITHKRHKRSRTQGKKGEVISTPIPLAVSVVKLVCPKCGKSTRVGYDISGQKKSRICKKCVSHID